MSVSTIPALIDALVAQATTALAGTATVYDGYPDTKDPSAFLAVGVDDPESQASASSVSGQQSMATMGTDRSRDEVFSLTCAAYAWNSDADQKAARDDAAAILEAVATLLRADPTMGVGLPGRVVCQIDTVSLSQDKNANGADALFIFAIANKARI